MLFVPKPEWCKWAHLLRSLCVQHVNLERRSFKLLTKTERLLQVWGQYSRTNFCVATFQKGPTAYVLHVTPSSSSTATPATPPPTPTLTTTTATPAPTPTPTTATSTATTDAAAAEAEERDDYEPQPLAWTISLWNLRVLSKQPICPRVILPFGEQKLDQHPFDVTTLSRMLTCA